MSPAGRLLAVAGERAILTLFDAQTGELLRCLEGHDLSTGKVGGVTAVTFSPDDDVLYSGGEDRRIIRWSGRRVTSSVNGRRRT